MHSNFLHELNWILSDVKPNSAKFDSAITDLADIVFTSKDYDENLFELEDIYIHEGNGSNFRFGFAGFYLLSVIYRRACDRQKLQSLITHGATRFEDNIDFKLVYLSCYEFCNPLGKSHAELLEDANTLCSRFPDRPSCLHVYAHIVASLMESGVEVDAAYLDEAIEFVDRAISLDSSYPKYRVTRARLYALKGDMNKAYIDFDKAVSLLHPTSPEYPKHLADIEAARLRADFLSSNKRIADRASKEIENVKASVSSNVEIVGLFSAVLSVVFTMASITSQSSLKFFELAFLACSLFGLLIMVFAVFSLISGRDEKLCRRLIVFGIVFAFIPIALYGVAPLIVSLMPGK